MPQASLQTADALESQANAIVATLTCAEKVALLSGKEVMTTHGVSRHNLPGIIMTDGPHGVTSAPATCFPSGIGLSATWNEQLIADVGACMASEVLAKGKHILLGPCVNMVRHVLGGRNFESFGEDPILSGKLGCAYVTGVHSKGVGTSLKHFACNNQEDDRLRASAEVDERTLREYYLPHFEMIIRETDPWTVMCSYNRINGIYASQHHYLLTDILRSEWGYKGVVVSDWGANHSIFESVAAGLDLEMPGPSRYYGKILIDAITNREIPESTIDLAATRMVRMLLRAQNIDTKAKKTAQQNTPVHVAMARLAAAESVTLLKNSDSLLPLNLKKIRTLAVIGPNSQHIPRGGGSSNCTPPTTTTILDALKKIVPATCTIVTAEGCVHNPAVPAITMNVLRGPDKKSKGLAASYWDNCAFAHAPVKKVSGVVPDYTLMNGSPVPEVNPLNYSIRWEGYISAPSTGLFRLRASAWGDCRVVFNKKVTIDTRTKRLPGKAWFDAQWFVDIALTKGTLYPVTVEYFKTQKEEAAHCRLGFGLSPEDTWQEKIARAQAVAQSADAVLICAGFPDGWEGEANDRPHMELPGRQNELIEAVVRTNPRTAVVILAGSPCTMPWIDKVKSVLWGYYPGMEGGAAIADIITGKINPSGKLPITLPKRFCDTPAFTNYKPTDNKMIYGEGVFVGYRWYDSRDIDPLFPFGHGLSYTTFNYTDLALPITAHIGDTIAISCTMENSGDQAGSEVVQLYVRDMASSLPRPIRELKRFSKVTLKAKQSTTVLFTLDTQCFAFYIPDEGGWIVEPGDFIIEIGSSSRDTRLMGKIVLR